MALRLLVVNTGEYPENHSMGRSHLWGVNITRDLTSVRLYTHRAS